MKVSIYFDNGLIHYYESDVKWCNELFRKLTKQLGTKEPGIFITTCKENSDVIILSKVFMVVKE